MYAIEWREYGQVRRTPFKYDRESAVKMVAAFRNTDGLTDVRVRKNIIVTEKM